MRLLRSQLSDVTVNVDQITSIYVRNGAKQGGVMVFQGIDQAVPCAVV